MTAGRIAGALALAGAVAASGAGLSLAGQAPADDAVEKIEKALSAVSAMTAQFTQNVENKRFGQAREAKGTLAILKPSMMRWEYTEPSELLIVADGDKLWHYDKAANSVSAEPLQGYMGPRSPILFLAGREPLSQAFEVSMVKTAPERRDEISLKLIPRDQAYGLKGALLKVDSRSYIIKEIILVDHLGNRNTISFSHVDTAAAPEKSLFKFTPPAGAEVQPSVKAPGM